MHFPFWNYPAVDSAHIDGRISPRKYAFELNFGPLRQAKPLSEERA